MTVRPGPQAQHADHWGTRPVVTMNPLLDDDAPEGAVAEARIGQYTALVWDASGSASMHFTSDDGSDVPAIVEKRLSRSLQGVWIERLIRRRRLIGGARAQLQSVDAVRLVRRPERGERRRESSAPSRRARRGVARAPGASPSPGEPPRPRRHDCLEVRP